MTDPHTPSSSPTAHTQTGRQRGAQHSNSNSTNTAPPIPPASSPLRQQPKLLFHVSKPIPIAGIGMAADPAGTGNCSSSKNSMAAAARKAPRRRRRPQEYLESSGDSADLDMTPINTTTATAATRQRQHQMQQDAIARLGGPVPELQQSTPPRTPSNANITTNTSLVVVPNAAYAAAPAADATTPIADPNAAAAAAVETAANTMATRTGAASSSAASSSSSGPHVNLHVTVDTAMSFMRTSRERAESAAERGEAARWQKRGAQHMMGGGAKATASSARSAAATTGTAPRRINQHRKSACSAEKYGSGSFGISPSSPLASRLGTGTDLGLGRLTVDPHHLRRRSKSGTEMVADLGRQDIRRMLARSYSSRRSSTNTSPDHMGGPRSSPRRRSSRLTPVNTRSRQVSVGSTPNGGVVAAEDVAAGSPHATAAESNVAGGTSSRSLRKPSMRRQLSLGSYERGRRDSGRRTDGRRESFTTHVSPLRAFPRTPTMERGLWLRPLPVRSDEEDSEELMLVGDGDDGDDHGAGSDDVPAGNSMGGILFPESDDSAVSGPEKDVGLEFMKVSSPQLPDLEEVDIEAEAASLETMASNLQAKAVEEESSEQGTANKYPATVAELSVQTTPTTTTRTVVKATVVGASADAVAAVATYWTSTTTKMIPPLETLTRITTTRQVPKGYDPKSGMTIREWRKNRRKSRSMHVAKTHDRVLSAIFDGELRKERAE